MFARDAVQGGGAHELGHRRSRSIGGSVHPLRKAANLPAVMQYDPATNNPTYYPQTPYEQAPNAQASYGQQPYEQKPYGEAPYVEAPYGGVPYEQTLYGQAPYAQTPYAQTPYAQTPYAQAPYGELPYGQQNQPLGNVPGIEEESIGTTAAQDIPENVLPPSSMVIPKPVINTESNPSSFVTTMVPVVTTRASTPSPAVTTSVPADPTSVLTTAPPTRSGSTSPPPTPKEGMSISVTAS
ncbi:hypothetical protein MRX96_014840 [Rhipicephalus microplus]